MSIANEIKNKDIPLNDISALYLRYKPQIDQGISDVLHSAKFINGPWVKELAQKLVPLSGCEFVIPCGNGTDALQLALMALDLERGSEVITSTYSFASAAETITLLGLKPVFVDIHLDTFNMDLAQVSSAITERTKAIIPIHLFGQGVPMVELMDIASAHDLYVIEDNAQSFGAMQDGQPLGSFGHIATTSFFPTKNLGCFGDGGGLFTNDLDLGTKLKSLANHGTSRKYHHMYTGINSRLDSLQAAILMVFADHLTDHLSKRQDIGKRYIELLADVSQVQLPKYSSEHTFNQITLLVEHRDELNTYLRSQGIGTNIYYPECLHEQPAFANKDVPKSFANAEYAAANAISLPMHPLLSIEEQNRVVSNISSFYKQYQNNN